jgi:menaquinone-specific isochorismate synthase
MSPITINGRILPLCHMIETLPKIDLMAWLDAQAIYPKVFWKERDSHITRAAVGSLLHFSEVPEFTGSSGFDVRLYGGLRFCKNRRKDKIWQEFPEVGFWLPEIEISQEDGKTSAVSYSPSASLNLRGNLRRGELPKFLEQVHLPCQENWQKSVEFILNKFSSDQIDKLVLARKTSFTFASPPSCWHILSTLSERAKGATLFAFQLSPQVCFLGATPEKLFQRRGNLFSADAVAATRPRGKTLEEDQQLETDLLTSSKEQREFGIVKDFLGEALLPLSEKMQWEEVDRVIKGSHVQHLYNCLKAELKEGISDRDLIHALHPTPALGGYPRDKSLDLLKEIEPFDRGWYGAPVGVIGNQQTSLYVAIRSGLIQGCQAHLFAGTGLVPGSIPDREWEELEHKVRPFTELFFKKKPLLTLITF